MHHHDRGSIALHVIGTGVDEEKINQVQLFIRSYGNSIYFYSIDDVHVNSFITMSTWTSAVYYRLYFPFLLAENMERVIYLDCDTIVLRSLDKLYCEDLGDCCVGAVYDNYVEVQPLIGIEEKGEYFNSGMLLIDLPRWREAKISESAFSYLMNFPERIRFVDQCALNAVLRHRWKRLPEKYNFLYSYFPVEITSTDLGAIEKNVDVIHFTLQRPWHMLCKNPFRDKYKYYHRNSPDKDRLVVVDFSLMKIPTFLNIRFKEFYLKNHLTKAIWRWMKGLVKAKGTVNKL